MTKFYAEFPNFIQNLETGEYWILQNIKLRLSLKSTGQYGSSIQFYSRWMISQVSSVSLLVYTLLCVESWSTDSWVWSQNWGVSGDIEGCKISLSAMQMPICQKRSNFWIPYLFSPLQMPLPLQCRPGRMPPPRPAATASLPFKVWIGPSLFILNIWWSL